MQIRIPANMRSLADGCVSCSVEATSVGKAVDELLNRYPALKPRLVDDQGAPQPFVNLFLNGQSVRDLEGMDTQIEGDTELLIVAALAGG